MFTGLIEESGYIRQTSHLPDGGIELTIEADNILDDLKIDDSVNIDGACQTVVYVDKKMFRVQAVEETLRKTTLGSFRSGKEVNLERAVKLTDRMGGHLVQGHVDCVGSILSIVKEGAGINLWISFSPEFGKYLVNTGSVCVNGISLTTASVSPDKFMVAIIPHTWNSTTMRNIRTGDKVNLEFDIVGKYIEKLVKQTKDTASGLNKYIDQPDL